MPHHSSTKSEPVAPGQPASKARRLLGNLALSVCSLLIFVGMLEGMLRWMGYGNVEIYQADPLLYWRLKPNQNCYTKVNHRTVHINAQGTRGAEFAVQKPANGLRIVSLGDSRTFGWGLAENETYSGLLEHLLREHLGPNRKVEVINGGVNAWSFPQMLAYFRERALRYQPDYVLVGDANLWTQFSEQNSPQFVRQFMRRVRLKNFLRHFALYHYFIEVKLSEFYQQYRLKFMPVDPAQDTLFKEQQQKDPDAFFRKAIERLCTTALSHHVTPILIYFPTADEGSRPLQSHLRQAKAQISQELKIPFLDLTADLTGPGKSLYLDADPVHFNVEGNELIARRLFQTVTNLVAHSQ